MADRLLLGGFVAGTSVWHRAGVGVKYLVALLLTVPALTLQQPVVTVALGLVAAGCLLLTRLPVRLTLGVPVALLLLMVALGVFQLAVGSPWLAVVVPLNLLLAVHAARLITLTTPVADLMDALVRAARPLRALGVDPERLALAVAVMIRSVPYLMGAFAEVREAAWARGREGNLLARLTPVVVRAVGYAQATGEALAARGLGERATGKPLG